MSSLIGTSKFLTVEQLPHIEAMMVFSEVYKKLSNKHVSGFLLVQSGMTTCYVKGAELAQTVIELANDDSTLLKQYCSTPLGSLLAIIGPIPVSPIVPLIPDPIAVDSNEGLLDEQSEAIFYVVDKGKQIGWYLNKDSTVTKRTVFICSRSHDNYDPDGGSCYKCPAKIVRTEIR